MNYEILERLDLATFEESRWRLKELQHAFLEDGLPDEAARNMADLCAISSAELALITEAANSDEDVSIIHVDAEVVPIASLKMNCSGTLLHLQELPNRIENGQTRLFDLFMFSSDHEKFTKIMESGSSQVTPETLRESFTDWVEQFVDEIGKSQVSQAMGLTDTRNEDVLHFEALLWRLRLGVLLQEEEESNEGHLKELAEKWNVGQGMAVP